MGRGSSVCPPGPQSPLPPLASPTARAEAPSRDWGVLAPLPGEGLSPGLAVAGTGQEEPDGA